MAVEALSAAQRRAMEAGRTVVVVIDGDLVRIDPSGRTVLKHIGPRPRAAVRHKQATT